MAAVRPKVPTEVTVVPIYCNHAESYFGASLADWPKNDSNVVVH